MMCYKDRSFCFSLTDVHTCGRELTEEMRLEAERMGLCIAGNFYCESDTVGVSDPLDLLVSPTAQEPEIDE